MRASVALFIVVTYVMWLMTFALLEVGIVHYFGEGFRGWAEIFMFVMPAVVAWYLLKESKTVLSAFGKSLATFGISMLILFLLMSSTSTVTWYDILFFLCLAFFGFALYVKGLPEEERKKLLGTSPVKPQGDETELLTKIVSQEDDELVRKILLGTSTPSHQDVLPVTVPPKKEPPTPPVKPQEDVTELLRKIAQLKEEGLLTEGEFEEKKKELLKRL